MLKTDVAGNSDQTTATRKKLKNEAHTYKKNVKTNALPPVKSFANNRINYLRKRQLSSQEKRNTVNTRNTAVPSTHTAEIAVQTENAEIVASSVNATAVPPLDLSTSAVAQHPVPDEDGKITSKSFTDSLDSALKHVENALSPRSTEIKRAPNPYAVFNIVKSPPKKSNQPDSSQYSSKLAKSNDLSNVPTTICDTFKNSQATKFSQPFEKSSVILQKSSSNPYHLIKELEKDLDTLQDEAVKLFEKKNGMSKKIMDPSSSSTDDNLIEVFFPKSEKIPAENVPAAEKDWDKRNNNDLEEFHALLNEVQERHRMLNDNLEQNVHSHESEELNKMFELMKIDHSIFKEQLHIKQKVDEYITSLKPQIMAEVKHRLQEIQQKPKLGTMKSTAPEKSIKSEGGISHSKGTINKAMKKSAGPATGNVLNKQSTQLPNKHSLRSSPTHGNARQSIKSGNDTTAPSRFALSKGKNTKPLTNKSKTSQRSNHTSPVRPFVSPKQIREPRPYFHLQNSVPQSVLWPPAKTATSFQREALLSNEVNHSSQSTKDSGNLHSLRRLDFQISNDASMLSRSERKDTCDLVGFGDGVVSEVLKRDGNNKVEKRENSAVEDVKREEVLFEKVGTIGSDGVPHKQTSEALDQEIQQNISGAESVGGSLEALHSPRIKENEAKEISSPNFTTLQMKQSEERADSLLRNEERPKGTAPDRNDSDELPNEVRLQSSILIGITNQPVEILTSELFQDSKSQVDILAAGDVGAVHAEYKAVRENSAEILVGSSFNDEVKEIKRHTVRFQDPNGSHSEDLPRSSLLSKVMLSPDVHDIEPPSQKSCRGKQPARKKIFEQQEKAALEEQQKSVLTKKDEEADMHKEIDVNKNILETISEEGKVSSISENDNSNGKDGSESEENSYTGLQVCEDKQEVSVLGINEENLPLEISISTQDIGEEDKFYSEDFEIPKKSDPESAIQNTTPVTKDSVYNEIVSPEILNGIEINGEEIRNLNIIDEELAKENIDKDILHASENESFLMNGFSFAGFNIMEKHIGNPSTSKVVLFPRLQKKAPPNPGCILPSSETSAQKLLTVAQKWVGQELLARSLSLLVPPSAVHPDVISKNSTHYTTPLSDGFTAGKGLSSRTLKMQDVDQKTLKVLLVDMLSEKAMKMIRERLKTDTTPPPESPSYSVHESEFESKTSSSDYEVNPSISIPTPLPTPTPSPEHSLSVKKDDVSKVLPTPTPSLESLNGDNEAHSNGNVSPLNQEILVIEKTPPCTPSPRKIEKEEMSSAVNSIIPPLTPSLSEEERFLQSVALSPMKEFIVEQGTQVSPRTPSQFEPEMMPQKTVTFVDEGRTIEPRAEGGRDVVQDQLALLDAATSPLRDVSDGSQSESFTFSFSTLSEGEWRPRGIHRPALKKQLPELEVNLERQGIKNPGVLAERLDNTLTDVEEIEQELYSLGEIIFKHPVNNKVVTEGQQVPNLVFQRKLSEKGTEVSLQIKDEAHSPGEVISGFLASFPPVNGGNNDLKRERSPGEYRTSSLKNSAVATTEHLVNLSDSDYNDASYGEIKNADKDFRPKISSAEDDIQTLRSILDSISEHSLSKKDKTPFKNSHVENQGTKVDERTAGETNEKIAFSDVQGDNSASQRKDVSLNANQEICDDDDNKSEDLQEASNVQQLVEEKNDIPQQPPETNQHDDLSESKNDYSEGEIVF